MFGAAAAQSGVITPEEKQKIDEAAKKSFEKQKENFIKDAKDKGMNEAQIAELLDHTLEDGKRLLEQKFLSNLQMQTQSSKPSL